MHRSTARFPSCETRRKLARLALAALVGFCLTSGPARAAAQARVEPAASGQAETGAAHEAGVPAAEEHQGRGIVDVIARLANFAILAGTLVYLLRSPIRTYLTDRSARIRSDLVDAAGMKQAAAAQIAEIDRKMQALPGELEALRTQGAQEIAAEEERIRAAAAAERERLLEQARREIDLQVKVAERDLVSYAAELAVGVASERIKRTITEDDQRRLVDRYVGQLRGRERGRH